MFSRSVSALLGCRHYSPASYCQCRLARQQSTRVRGSGVLESGNTTWRSLHYTCRLDDASGQSDKQAPIACGTTTAEYDQRPFSVRFLTYPRPEFHSSEYRKQIANLRCLASRIYGDGERSSSENEGVAAPPSSPTESRLLTAPPIQVLKSTCGVSGENRSSDPPSKKSLLQSQFEQEWYRLRQHLFSATPAGLSTAQQELDAYRQVAITFVGHRDRDELRDAWFDMTMHQRLSKLPTILIGSLVDSARRTLLMLSVIPTLPRDWKVRCECLSYLELVHRKEITASPYLQDLFAKQIELVSKVWAWPEQDTMPRAFLVLLLRHNGPDVCENIIDTVFQNYNPVSPRLILPMVDHYTKTGDPDRAFELLSQVSPERHEDLKEPIFNRCANLIRSDTIEESGAVRNFKLLPKLMDFGMPMDARAHNLIIHRAISLKLPSVAWEVYRFMAAENIPADPNTHLLLLKDSFEHQHQQQLDEIMSAIHQREDLYQYPYLVAYMMHIVRVVCSIDRQLAPEVSMSHLLAIYDRAYNRGPLINLHLVSGDLSASKDLPEPPPVVLGFTIWAIVLCQRADRPVASLWHWIMHLIQRNDESICAAAKHDILYNGFIHFYARRPATLKKGVFVLEKMFELGLCMPTERTWSEVLCGFLRFDDEATAAKIWELMMEQDIQPTKDGWEFLLQKYDRSMLAQQVRYVLEERQMPEGLEAVMRWPWQPGKEPESNNTGTGGAGFTRLSEAISEMESSETSDYSEATPATGQTGLDVPPTGQ